MTPPPAVEKRQRATRRGGNPKAQPSSMEVVEQFDAPGNGCSVVMIAPHPLVHAAVNDTLEGRSRVGVAGRKAYFQGRGIAETHQLIHPLFRGRWDSGQLQHLAGDLVE